MPVNFQDLRLRQLDASLARWRDAALPERPPSGWVRAIRQALGMSSKALAARQGITDSAVRKFEHAEARDAMTLESLRRLAASLDCELRYALVPRQPLAAMREERALALASEQVQSVARSMALEDQAVDLAVTQAQARALAQTLLAKPGARLWR